MWEEIHRGGTDMPLANYGWPTREGPCQRGSFRKCFVGSKQPSKIEEPLYYYPHIRHVLLNGGVVDEIQPQKGELSTGVFVPQEAGWPSSYRFLFYDKVAETIFHLIPNARQACPTCAPPNPAFSNTIFSDAFHNVIDMSFFGQYKELYVTTCNSYDGCRLWNVQFKGNANHHRLPVAAIQIQNRTGDYQETISFDAGNGTKNAVAYYWDFGDGLTSTRKRPTHTYKSIGNYPITLFIKDKDGIVTQDIYMIFVNWLLYVFILIPSWGGRFAVGQALSLVGGVDTPIGDFLPDSQLFWG
jgi:PKD domain